MNSIALTEIIPVLPVIDFPVVDVLGNGCSVRKPNERLGTINFRMAEGDNAGSLFFALCQAEWVGLDGSVGSDDDGINDR